MAANLPLTVKHVALAVWKKRAVRTFPEAITLAVAQLTTGGYLAPGSDKGELADIRLTMKGVKRERERRRESARKMIEFDRLYKKHASELEKGRKDRESPDGSEE